MNLPETAGRDVATLVVDDDVQFCAVLRDALRRRGLTCLVAHDFADAISEAAAWNPGRAIVDLRMPGPGGLEVVSALRRSHPTMAIVVLTGFGSIATAVEAIKLGARNYLTKPAEVDAILAAFEAPAEGPLPSLDELEREHTRRAFAETGGNVSRTARILGIDRRTLQRRLARDPTITPARPGVDDASDDDHDHDRDRDDRAPAALDDDDLTST